MKPHRSRHLVLLARPTLGVNSDYSAFCIEGTPGCKYYEAAAYAAYCNRLCFVNFSVLLLRKVSCSLNWRQVPMFVTNSSSPVECGQNYPYGSRGYAELWSVLGVALGWLQERKKATVSESWSILDLIPLHVLDLLFIYFSFCCLSPMYLLRICGYWCLYQSLLFVWFVAVLP